jgi:hypothetical protein
MRLLEGNTNVERSRNGVPSFVSLRIAVDSELAHRGQHYGGVRRSAKSSVSAICEVCSRGQIDSRLLHHFTNDSVLYTFAILDVPPRNGETMRGMLPLTEHNPNENR